jgi:hypothetical protein
MSSPVKKMTEAFLLGLLFVTKGPFQYFHLKTLTGRVLTVFMAIVSTLVIASVAYREQINQALLKVRKSDKWKYLLDKYFNM